MCIADRVAMKLNLLRAPGLKPPPSPHLLWRKVSGGTVSRLRL